MAKPRKPGQPSIDPNASDAYDGPSKSKRKRDMNALQEYGEKLVLLPDKTLAKMPLPEQLREAVLLARRINDRSGGRRQLQYIGRLMREIDASEIIQALDSLEQQHHNDTAQLHHAEQLRTDLLARGEAAIAEFLIAYPQTDRQTLSQLVLQAQTEQHENKPLKAYRELFRHIKTLI